MAEQTEMEIAGVKFKGGKIFLVLTALSTLGGGAWACFEFYKDYMDMREMITSYVAPDLSGFQEQLSIQNTRLEAVEQITDVEMKGMRIELNSTIKEVNSINEQATQTAQYAKDLKNSVRDDLLRMEQIVDRLEDDVKDSEGDVRSMIDIAEQRFENKRDALQNDYDQKAERLNSNVKQELKELEARLNFRLQRALDNPLAQ